MALSRDEESKLLLLARRVIEGFARKESRAEPTAPVEENLLENRGAFVSLHKGSSLRGCIGVFTPETPLYKTVAEMALSAASNDNRFRPVEASELPDITIEISALTPLERITDTSAIEIGTHGIYIIKGMNRGVLLPQVATEHNFGREEFLQETCYKAGLSGECWKDESTEIYTFKAEVFSEEGN